MSTKVNDEAELGVDPLHQAVAAAVHVFAADHVVAGPEQLEHGVERGEAGAEARSRGVAPSSAATFRSSASRVGFWVRAYS